MGSRCIKIEGEINVIDQKVGRRIVLEMDSLRRRARRWIAGLWIAGLRIGGSFGGGVSHQDLPPTLLCGFRWRLTQNQTRVRCSLPLSVFE